MDGGKDRRGGDRADAGKVINRLAVASALNAAASSLSIAPIASSSASIWPTSERSAPRHASGTTILAILVETVGKRNEMQESRN